MPEPKPPEKKIKVPKPPEYLPSTEGIPPELQALLGQPETVQGGQPSLLGFLAYWEQQNPQGLYEMQFTDYLVQMYRDKMKGLTEKYTKAQAAADTPKKLALAEAIYVEDETELNELIKSYHALMREKRSMNFPVQDMPFYKEIKAKPSAILGGYNPSIQKAYNEFRQQRFLEAQEAQREQQKYEQEYERWATGEIAKPIVAEQRERLSEYERVQQAMRDPTSPQARRVLQDAVERGMIAPEEAYGPGSAWEKWQHTQVMEGGKGVNRQTDAVQTLERMIMQARQAGIDTTQAEGTYKQHAFAGGNDMPLARESQGLNEAIQQVKQRGRAKESRILASQYPDVYKQWATELQKGYAGSSPGTGWESLFSSWAQAAGTEEEPLTPQQEAFQKQRTQTELEMWRKYGDIYAGYTDYLQGTGEEGIKPIEQWIEETPLAKLAMERRQPRIQRQPYARWR